MPISLLTYRAVLFYFLFHGIDSQILYVLIEVPCKVKNKTKLSTLTIYIRSLRIRAFKDYMTCIGHIQIN